MLDQSRSFRGPSRDRTTPGLDRAGIPGIFSIKPLKWAREMLGVVLDESSVDYRAGSNIGAAARSLSMPIQLLKSLNYLTELRVLDELASLIKLRGQDLIP